MKPIVSNLKGYHIHSPSAFHLITEVIYNPKTPACLSLEQVVDLEKKSPFSLLVLKLADHYKPLRLVCVGHGGLEPMEFLPQSGIPIKVYNTLVEIDSLVNQHEFVIWTEVPENDRIIPETINDCLWFVPMLERKESRKYFTLLKKNGKVSQSFELNQHGFVIFNSKLQKEDYIIRNRRFFINY
ncbi:MAG TPA: hypothetical protein DCY35_09430 [Prolixibacteraceae bacterium]|nr:hypothetical protein [Prolixibacteraceae bacterium]